MEQVKIHLVCPKCDANDLWADHFENDEAEVWRTITCQTCLYNWQEVYRFSHNETEE